MGKRLSLVYHLHLYETENTTWRRITSHHNRKEVNLHKRGGESDNKNALRKDQVKGF